MWIQVRTFDGSKNEQVDGLSKLTKIEELRTRLVELFDVPTNRQRLFFRGKQVRINKYHGILCMIPWACTVFQTLSDSVSLCARRVNVRFYAF